MVRSLVLSALVVTMAVWALGCGGQPDFVKNAAVAKPTDIGDPSQVAMGATLISDGANWIVKADVKGEKRIFVLVNRAPGTSDPVTFDSESQQFVSKNGKKKYDVSGNALQTLSKGANAGQPAASLQLRPLTLDASNGHMMLSGNKVVAKGERDNKDKGAYIIAP